MKKIMIGTGVMLLAALIISFVCIVFIGAPEAVDESSVSIPREEEQHYEIGAAGIAVPIEGGEETDMEILPVDKSRWKDEALYSAVIEQAGELLSEPESVALFGLEEGDTLLAIGEPVVIDGQEWIQVLASTIEEGGNSPPGLAIAYIEANLTSDFDNQKRLPSEALWIGTNGTKRILTAPDEKSDAKALFQPGLVLAVIDKVEGEDGPYYVVMCGDELGYLPSFLQGYIFL